MTKDFITGFQYFIKGMHLVNKPGVRRFVLIPLGVNIILYIFLIWLGVHYFSKLSTILLDHIPSWFAWIINILWVIVFIIITLFMYLTFNIIANLLAAPFNGILSEKLQTQLLKQSRHSSAGFIVTFFNSFKRQIQFILYYLLRVVIMLILFCIPIIHLAFPVLWIFFNAWMLSLQYLDYPMDNNGISFKHHKIWMQNNKGLILGFGCAVTLFNLIPVINFIIMPVAVCGATLMWVECCNSSTQKEITRNSN